jgi:hypothetical protein
VLYETDKKEIRDLKEQMRKPLASRKRRGGGGAYFQELLKYDEASRPDVLGHLVFGLAFLDWMERVL